jgi:YVTN family beta-propeller protein
MASENKSEGSAAQLTAELLNSGSGTPTQNVIYITADESYNKLSLQLALTSGTAPLTPGTIPDPSGPPPTTGTTIYMDLSALELSSSAWSALELSGIGWTFQTFPSQNMVGMTPASGSSLTLGTGASGTLSIGILGIVLPAALNSPQIQLYLSYYGIPNVGGTYLGIPVALQNAPSGGQNLAQAIIATVTGGAVVNSIPPLLKAENLFSLQFAGTQNVQAQAGAKTLFTVAFVYGEASDPYGYGALTDLTNGGFIQVQAGLNASPWNIKQHISQQAVTWTLQPPDGQPIIGSGVQSVVQFNFLNVVTTYVAGPTLMLISYTGVPGYQDGTFVVVMEKVAHAQIKSLQVSPNPTYFGANGDNPEVDVSWVANDAPLGLMLTQNYQPNPVSGTHTKTHLTTESTTFTLIATGAAGSVPNTDSATATAIALPVINSFTGTPTEVYAGSLSHDVSCAWAVSSNAGVTLNSTGNAFSGQPFGAIGSTAAVIEQPQMVTLAPTTSVDQLTLTRRLVFSAFTPQTQKYPLNFSPAAAAASPSGPFVVFAGPGSQLTIADSIKFSAWGSTDLGAATTSLAFSADGTELAVTTASSVSIVALSLDASGMPQFSSAQTLPAMAGTPQRLIFSPNGPRVFVTVDCGANQPGQLVSLLKSGSTYQQEASITVGAQPRGLTLDASGARIYVANSGDDTVSIIGLTSKGAPAAVTLIHQVTGGPTGIAVTPSGKQLLVSCATAGTVVAIDPNYPDTGQRKTVTVGTTPGDLAVTPTGAYAFVVNTGDGTVSLLDCWGLPTNATALGAALPIGNAASSVSISPEGLQVLVAQTGGFSVITLATYHTPTQAPSIPNRPTSVSVAPDGSVAFAWHDASIPVVSPSPGILAYNTDSAVISNVLPSSNVLRCVTSPVIGAKQALAIVLGDPTLHLIDTDTLETSAVPLQVSSGTVPVALAISGEGTTAFVVVMDKTNALSLLVMSQSGLTWKTTQTLPLYTATSSFARILLSSTPDATSLFLVDVLAATVHVIQLSGQVYVLSPTVVKSSAQAVDIAILPDGSTAYVLNTGSPGNTITVVDIATLTTSVVAIPQTYVNLSGIQPSPDGRRLFATDTNAAALRVLDPQSLRIVQTIPLSTAASQASGAAGLAVMPDASQIFVANTMSQNLSIVEQIQMGTSARPEATPLPHRHQRRIALLGDTPYSGLFVRHYPGDSPGAGQDGWSASPDIIPNPNGHAIQPDLTQFTSPSGYQNPFGSTIYTSQPTGAPNFIYIRGLNTTNAPITSRAYFYYVPGGLALWPGNWETAGVTVNGVSQYWVDITAPANTDPATNGVGVCQSPLVWNATPVPAGSDHYCMTVWVVNGPNPQPPDWKKSGTFSTLEDLANFIMANPNMGWRNTVDVTVPPADWTYSTGLQMGPAGGMVQVTVQFSGNLPMDGQFALSLQGTSAGNSIAIPPSPLGNYVGGYVSPFLSFPANFPTSVLVQHWPGPTPIPPSAKITVTLEMPTAPRFERDIELLCKRRGVRSPLRVRSGIRTFILGSTTYNILYQSQLRTELAR